MRQVCDEDVEDSSKPIRQGGKRGRGAGCVQAIFCRGEVDKDEKAEVEE